MHLEPGDQGEHPIVIGLDIGTTSIKGTAFALDGRAVASASVPTITHNLQPGSAFYRPNEFWDAAVTVRRGIVSQIDRPDRIAGIATASMGEAGVLLDAFRLRFRPWARGPADASDAAMAADLARRHPADRSADGAVAGAVGGRAPAG